MIKEIIEAEFFEIFSIIVKMNKMHFMVILLIIESKFLHTHKIQPDWLRVLTHQLIERVQPYQIVFSMSKFSKNSTDEINSIIKLVNGDISIPMISLENFDISNSSALNSSLFLKHVSLHIVLDGTDCENTNSMVDVISRVSPTNVRPQIFVIIFHTKQIKKSKIQQILQHAWKKKFLDVSILTIDKNNHEMNNSNVFYFWNPFLNFLSVSSFDLNTQIFPNKVSNFNGYTLRLPTANFPPFIEVEKRNNEIIKVTGLYYPFLEFILKTMNFTLVFGYEIDFYSDLSLNYFTNTRLKNGDENMMIITSPIHISNAVVMVKVDYIYRELLAIVPIVPTTKINIPKDVFLYAFVIPVFIIFFLRVMQFFKIISSHWKVFEIIQLLLGVTVRLNFKTSDVAVIYSCMIVASIVYTNNLYSSMLGINLEHTELSLKTFEEIDDSGLPILMNKIHLDRFYEVNSTNEHMNNMMKRTEKVVNIIECVDSIVNGETVICITTNWHANFFVKQYRAAEKRIFKVIRLPVPSDKIGFMFEPASPFAERFDVIQRKVIESGIWFKLVSDDLAVNKRKKYNTLEVKFSIFKLVPVVTIGYFLAITAFFIEYCLGKKRSYKFVTKCKNDS